MELYGVQLSLHVLCCGSRTVVCPGADGEARRNPGDSMLVERLERMSVNAKAFLGLNRPAMAARCYETMAQILPDDPGPVKGYGDCMRLMGRTDVAELAFKRVRELEERKRR